MQKAVTLIRRPIVVSENTVLSHTALLFFYCFCTNWKGKCINLFPTSTVIFFKPLYFTRNSLKGQFSPQFFAWGRLQCTEASKSCSLILITRHFRSCDLNVTTFSQIALRPEQQSFTWPKAVCHALGSGVREQWEQGCSPRVSKPRVAATLHGQCPHPGCNPVVSEPGNQERWQQTGLTGSPGRTRDCGLNTSSWA